MTMATRCACAAAMGFMCGAWLLADSPRPALDGRWEINRDLSTAVEGSPPPDDGRRGGRPPGPPPGGGRGGPGGGFGGGFGGGGARRGAPGGSQANRPSAEEMETQRALMDEAMRLPPRFTLIQKDGAITIMEPDGVVRTYVANGKAEKHQLTHGVIETRSQWKDDALEMELMVGRATIVRTFALRDASRQLEVTTTVKGAPKGRGQVTVFDESVPDAARLASASTTAAVLLGRRHA